MKQKPMTTDELSQKLHRDTLPHLERTLSRLLTDFEIVAGVRIKEVDIAHDDGEVKVSLDIPAMYIEGGEEG